MEDGSALGIVAGNGIYPLLLAQAARAGGVRAIYVAAFENETDPAIVQYADLVEWMRVGQLARMLSFFAKAGIHRAIMAGQIAPKNLFELRPDLKALMLLASLKKRNAETLFGAIANELSKIEVELLPATTYLENSLAKPGLIAGPKPNQRAIDDIWFGFDIAKEISRLDIGQTVVVRHGTVLAVEGFEGTNQTIRRGAALGKGRCVVVKVSKPNQDLRFDVPVIGSETIEVAYNAGVRCLAVESGKTLLLNQDAVKTAAKQRMLTLFGCSKGSAI
ncbi:MAG: UDP-2,3-diacylglucosamine diphosphatase LpxI [Verrucomicrobia bacterium]|nr:UDP-2,3-diacylglucosamine diphosphatase LpxI [Verrucomicrobiota bacterium]